MHASRPASTCTIRLSCSRSDHVIPPAIYAFGAAILLVAAVLPTRPKHARHAVIVIVLRIAAGISAVICVVESSSWLVAGIAVVVAVVTRIVWDKRGLSRVD